MQYLPLLLLLMATLIAAYFYLQRAKARTASNTTVEEPSTPAPTPADPVE